MNWISLFCLLKKYHERPTVAWQYWDLQVFLGRDGVALPPFSPSTLNREGWRRMAAVYLGPHRSGKSSFPGSLFAKMVWTSGVGAFFFPSWVSIYSGFRLLWCEVIDDYHGKGDCFFSAPNRMHTESTARFANTLICWNSKSQSAAMGRWEERDQSFSFNKHYVTRCCDSLYDPILCWAEDCLLISWESWRDVVWVIWEETREGLPGLGKAGSLNYSEFSKVSISSDKNANKKYKFITQFHSPSFRWNSNIVSATLILLWLSTSLSLNFHILIYKMNDNGNYFLALLWRINQIINLKICLTCCQELENILQNVSPFLELLLSSSFLFQGLFYFLYSRIFYIQFIMDEVELNWT